MYAYASYAYAYAPMDLWKASNVHASKSMTMQESNNLCKKGFGIIAIIYASIYVIMAILMAMYMAYGYTYGTQAMYLHLSQLTNGKQAMHI